LRNLKGRDHSENLGIDGNIILYWNRVGRCGLDASGSLLQDQWWAPVNIGMNLLVP
jgi:hypothetical protein